MIDLNARFRGAPDVVARDVPDGMMLVDVQTGAAFKLNRVGAQVWRLLDGARTVGDVAATLQQLYPAAPPHDIRGDVEALLDDLQRQRLVVPAGPP